MSRNNEKKRYALWLILFVCFFTSACSTISGDENPSNVVVNDVSEDSTGDVSPTHIGVQEESDIFIGSADLTHDGAEEKIVVDISSIEESQEAVLKVLDGEDNIIWQESAALPHVGWNSIYLCTIDEKEWLLRYNPYMSQGWASYSFELFSIDEQGIEKTLNSGSIDFTINTLGKEFEFDIGKMVSFYNEINKYLDQSILLLSTEQGKLEYSTKKGKITRNEEFSWLYNMNIEYDKNDSIEDKLIKYQDSIE